jgi:hypothetical protein
MFEVGETDEYPIWALPLLPRRIMWKEYGIPFSDFEFPDVMLMLRLQGLENRREKNILQKMQNKTG